MQKKTDNRKSFNRLFLLVALLFVSIFIMIKLYYFTKSDSIDLIFPKVVKKTLIDETKIRINIENNHYLINGQEVKQNNIEATLDSIIIKSGKPVILLQTNNSSVFDKSIFIMNIANKNEVKLIMVVNPN